MDTLQQQGERVRAARAAHNWSQRDLAEAARVAPNTVGAIEAGREVRPSSMSRVEQALGLDPIIEHAWNMGLPPDVQMVLEVLGYYLAELPEGERPRAAARILRALTQHANEAPQSI